MKNEKLGEFLYKNRLKSSDLVEFWGVTKGVVSQILNGTTKLPTKRLEELLNNPHGWDVSMLTESPVVLPDPEPAPAAEINMIDKLFALLEEKERNNALLLKILLDKEETIKHLTAEIAALKEKRETVSNVG
jgi:hypothetical protein